MRNTHLAYCSIDIEPDRRFHLIHGDSRRQKSSRSRHVLGCRVAEAIKIAVAINDD